MYWCSIALICSSVNAHKWANFFHSPGLSCLWANFRNIISRFSSVSCSVIETSKSGLHFHFLRSSGVFGLVLFCTCTNYKISELTVQGELIAIICLSIRRMRFLIFYLGRVFQTSCFYNHIHNGGETSSGCYV